MHKDTQKTSSRKTLILAFVVVLHACGLLFITHVNNWFPMKEHGADKEREKTMSDDIKTEKKGTNMKEKNDIKEQSITTNKIYLPEQIHLQDHDVEKDKNVASEPEVQITEELEMGSRKQQISEEIEIEQVKVIAPEEPVMQTEIKEDNIVQEKMKESTLKRTSLPEKTELTKEETGTVNDFNFTEYTKNLIKNYGVREGEKIPLLLIDDHNESRLYKKGLEFYGYRLISRPLVKPKDPYYFVIGSSGIQLMQETCPYAGAFPSVLQEDQNLFEELLHQPQFKELSKNQHQMFYAPIDTPMLNVIECKQKLILENMNLDIEQVSRMVGTFKKAGSSYILIIETIVTIDGKRLNVRDPDNIIVAVG
jgi:ribosomal protein L20A (L18A)